MNNEQVNELKKNQEIKWKLICGILVFAIVLVLVIVLCVKVNKNTAERYEMIVSELRAEITALTEQAVGYTVATKEVTIDLIKSEIKDIGELATLEYLYTDAGKFEDAKKLFGKNVPFTSKSFIAKWDGIIKAGVNIEQISIEVDNESKEIIVSIPKAEILSHEIEAESLETLDEKNGLFNKVSVDDVRTFDEESKMAMEERAIENGILDKALSNAKDIIERLVNNDVIKEQGYTIKFIELE